MNKVQTTMLKTFSNSFPLFSHKKAIIKIPFKYSFNSIGQSSYSSKHHILIYLQFSCFVLSSFAEQWHYCLRPSAAEFYWGASGLQLAEVALQAWGHSCVGSLGAAQHYSWGLLQRRFQGLFCLAQCQYLAPILMIPWQHQGYAIIRAFIRACLEHYIIISLWKKYKKASML